jgi:hypothetical protein
MPNRLWSTAVVASTSSSPSTSRTDASKATGTVLPAALSVPETCTRPIPVARTRVELNRICGWSPTWK